MITDTNAKGGKHSQASQCTLSHKHILTSRQ